MQLECYVAIAGWSIRKEQADLFAADGSHLQRYASRFDAVEINSSFYGPHRPATYTRWAASVPDDFRFSAKVPRTVTHNQRLVATEPLLDAFLSEVTCLGTKLGCLLVQLPPSLAYDSQITDSFFDAFRARYDGALVLEARHPTWFNSEVVEQLRVHRVGQVGADPACVPEAAEPAGWPEVVYVRLHGSPDVYYSAYDEPYLDRLAERLRDYAARAREVWCIFDNTARFHATPNALATVDRLTHRG